MYQQYDPRAFAHYEEGVRLGYIQQNPLTMTPEQKFQQAQQTAQRLQEDGIDAFALPDGTVRSKRSFRLSRRLKKQLNEHEQEALMKAMAMTAARHQEFMNTPVNPDRLNQLYP